MAARSRPVRLAVAVALSLGALAVHGCAADTGGSLEVGDCYDEPAAVTEAVPTIVPVPCAEPHDREVVFAGDFAPASDAYPSDEAFFDFESTTCLAAFQEYTGLDFTIDEDYGMASYKPTQEDWARGDRQVVCYAYRLDGAPLTRSIRKG